MLSSLLTIAPVSDGSTSLPPFPEDFHWLYDDVSAKYATVGSLLSNPKNDTRALGCRVPRPQIRFSYVTPLATTKAKFGSSSLTKRSGSPSMNGWYFTQFKVL